MTGRTPRPWSGTPCVPTFSALLLFVTVANLTPGARSACQQAAPVWIPVGNCSITSASQATINSWGILFSLHNSTTASSTPGSQSVCVTPSTVTNATLLTVPGLLCNDTALSTQNMTRGQCYSRRGSALAVDGAGNPVGLPTVSTAGLGSSNPGWIVIMGGTEAVAFPAAVNASLALHDGRSVAMVDGLIESGINHTASHLGLADSSTLSAALIAAGVTGPTRSWGFDAGSLSYARPRSGALTLGGRDVGAVAGSPVAYSMSAYNKVVNNQRVCPLQVTISSMWLVPSNSTAGANDSFQLVDSALPLEACLEMYDVYTRLPVTVLNNLKNYVDTMTGRTGGPVSYKPVQHPEAEKDPLLRQLLSLYINEPGLIYPANSTARFDASLVVTLEGGQTVIIPSNELFNPVRGLAADGSRAVELSFNELAVYQSEAPANAAVLGRSFLSQVYLFVDYDRGEFSLAPSARAASDAAPVSLVATDPVAGTGSGAGGDGCVAGGPAADTSPLKYGVNTSTHLGENWNVGIIMYPRNIDET
ncbi:hypothetical protein B0T24DRAFT_678103 [Lasiosphaeria ovina]|uniref:Peptidase A1 domain-containing protein n=1 Tax=Lasiosphaeria ovina TaxID=92902 RepID=A0AAE0NAY4_9PEZI|nr:hypothetical protein B0T24DRAFT_678103 [Lasiosphaeria ovina]